MSAGSRARGGGSGARARAALPTTRTQRARASTSVIGAQAWMDAPRAKRQATRYGLADAGAAVEFDQLVAAAEAGRARCRPRQVAADAGAAGHLAGAGALTQVSSHERCEDAEALDATTDSSGSAYHIEMLNDGHRNTAFATAVRRAVSAARQATGRAPTVLEIGAGGAALLSLVAADAGAGRCVAVECDPDLAESARLVLAANKSTAVVAAMHSIDLRCVDAGDPEEATDNASPTDVTLPAAGVDVLLSELFDDRLLGEQVLPTVRHALASLVAPHRLVVPASASIYAVLVQSDTIAMMSGPSAGVGVVTAPVNDPIEPMRVGGLQDLRIMSVPWEALTFNLSDLSQPPCSHRTVDVPLLDSAAAAGTDDAGTDENSLAASGTRIDAIMFWWRATLWEGGDAEAAEENSVVLSSGEPNSHWMPCIYPLADAFTATGPIIVGRHQHTVRVTAWHDEQSVEFAVKRLEEGTCPGTSPAIVVNADRAAVVSEGEDEVESDTEQLDGDTADLSDPHDELGTEDASTGEGAHCRDDDSAADPPAVDRTRRWMLADPARTQAISSAVVETIQAAVRDANRSRPACVVCVGGGSGLCARAALLSDEAHDGAISVLAVEWTAEHATAVRDAVTSISTSVTESGNQQGPACPLQVVDGASELKDTLQRILGNVESSGGTKETVAAMVAEPYFVALAEGRSWAKGHALLWWWSVHTARQSAGLVAPLARVWPALGRMRGMLVGFKRLWAATRPVIHPCAAPGDERTAQFDISEFGLRGTLAHVCSYGRAAPIWQHEHTVCSQPFNLLEMNFSGDPPLTLSTPPDGAAVVATPTAASTAASDEHTATEVAAGCNSGEPGCICNALIVWIDYAHADGTWPAELSTGPDLHTGGPTPWSQGICFLETPFVISCAEKGQQQPGVIARVHAQLDTLAGGLKLEVVAAAADRR